MFCGAVVSFTSTCDLPAVVLGESHNRFILTIVMTDVNIKNNSNINSTEKQFIFPSLLHFHQAGRKLSFLHIYCGTYGNSVQ